MPHLNNPTTPEMCLHTTLRDIWHLLTKDLYCTTLSATLTQPFSYGTCTSRNNDDSTCFKNVFQVLSSPSHYWGSYTLYYFIQRFKYLNILVKLFTIETYFLSLISVLTDAAYKPVDTGDGSHGDRRAVLAISRSPVKTLIITADVKQLVTEMQKMCGIS